MTRLAIPGGKPVRDPGKVRFICSLFLIITCITKVHVFLSGLPAGNYRVMVKGRKKMEVVLDKNLEISILNK